MSHLTEYTLLLTLVKELLDQDKKPTAEEHGQFGGTTVQFALYRGPSPKEVGDFYGCLRIEVEQSRLRPRRKSLYKKFARRAYQAHRSFREGQPVVGTVWHLHECIHFLIQAFKAMEEAQEYDDDGRHPVHWSEVYRAEGLDQQPPQEYWLLFKLESLLPVLRLSVIILRLVFPDCVETWNEWEKDLCRKEWLQQFILDSRKSSLSAMPTYAPRRDDIVGTGFPHDGLD
ncbi:hypothetical protein GGR57DRAFT_453119 [Xylariaceae sp. FL1272]|nr:hypothetical protein GGR57DRAFT_453119 [Xylariaceae sp. FL1272]